MENMILGHKTFKMPPGTSTKAISGKYFSSHFHEVASPFSENRKDVASTFCEKACLVSSMSLYDTSLKKS